HAAPGGHCDRETSAFLTTSQRLALTSQASRSGSVGGVRVRAFAVICSRAANRSALSTSAMRFARGLMCRELREVMNTKFDPTSQQKNHHSITFFIHRFPPELIHNLSPKSQLSHGFFRGSRALCCLQDGVTFI